VTHQPPSAASIAATTEVLELASLLDHRVPTPDKARVLAWAKQIDRHDLERDDMLDATQGFYDQPSMSPISVGDVIAGARRIKRDRLSREEAAEREARQERNDQKAADEIRAFSAAALTGRTKETPRLKAARAALDDCHGRDECKPAIEEFCAAKQAAAGRPKTAKR
jgi:hypothetical protein